MGVEEFVGRLAATDPAAAAILRDHLADNEDELLLHPLVARIRDLAISSFDEGNLGLAARLVAVFDEALRVGDGQVENSVAVSFVEDTPWWDPARQEFIATWPATLRAEYERLRAESERRRGRS